MNVARCLFAAWAIACIGFTTLEIRDRIQARRKYQAFEARCRARLVEMYAVKRDPYDGRPI